MKVYRIVYHDDDRGVVYDNGYFVHREDAEKELERILSLDDEFDTVEGNTHYPDDWSIEEVEVKE